MITDLKELQGIKTLKDVNLEGLADIEKLASKALEQLTAQLITEQIEALKLDLADKEKTLTDQRFALARYEDLLPIWATPEQKETAIAEIAEVRVNIAFVCERIEAMREVLDRSLTKEDGWKCKLPKLINAVRSEREAREFHQTHPDVMSKGHPRFDEFVSRLEGPEGCNLSEESCTCHHNHDFAAEILADMGGIDIPGSIEYFQEHGGWCDCEILFNVAD